MRAILAPPDMIAIAAYGMALSIALSFGPTWGYDVVSYLPLIEYASQGDWSRLHQLFSHSYVGLGPGGLFALATLFPGNSYAFVAGFQVLLYWSVCAIMYMELRARRLCWLGAVSLVLLLTWPFLNYFHHAPLSESVSLSLILFSFSMALRLERLNDLPNSMAVGWCLTLLVAAQFRSTSVFQSGAIVVALLSYSFAAEFFHRGVEAGVQRSVSFCTNPRLWLALFCAIMGILAYPVVRSINVGQWSPPQMGGTALINAANLNLSVSPDTRKRLGSLDLPPKLSEDKFWQTPNAYQLAQDARIELAHVCSGAKCRRDRAAEISRVLLEQSDLAQRRLIVSLHTMGVASAYDWLGGQGQITRNTPPNSSPVDILLAQYRLFSGTELVSRDVFPTWFDERPESQHSELVSTWIEDWKDGRFDHSSRRDPFSFAAIDPSLIALLGTIGLLTGLIQQKTRPVSVALLIALMFHWTMMYSTASFGLRYSHSVFFCYLIGCGLLGTAAFSALTASIALTARRLRRTIDAASLSDAEL